MRKSFVRSWFIAALLRAFRPASRAEPRRRRDPGRPAHAAVNEPPALLRSTLPPMR